MTVKFMIDGNKIKSPFTRVETLLAEDGLTMKLKGTDKSLMARAHQIVMKHIATWKKTDEGTPPRRTVGRTKLGKRSLISTSMRSWQTLSKR